LQPDFYPAHQRLTNATPFSRHQLWTNLLGLSQHYSHAFMSGLETVAAVIGISDAALRAISLFYETIDDLKKAPRDIQVLKSEIGGLQECLLQLKRLSTQDEKALSTIKNFGLRDIVDNCAGACETLRTAIQKWSGPGVNDLWSRFQFVLNKKDIEKARDITSNAKQTTILAVVITQL
jgi:hypothetical protein